MDSNANFRPVPWRLERAFWPALFALAVVVVIFEFSSLDLWLQDWLFDFEHHEWLINRHEPWSRAMFYTGPKIALIALGLVALALTAGPAAWRRCLGLLDQRAQVAVLFLSLATVPALIGGGKAVTNVYCPSELQRYGGEVRYTKLFERLRADEKPERCGRCFPAGHASGGFALLALAFLGRTRGQQRVGLGIGLGAGCLMGLYQMANGAHFASHTMVTALLAWIVASGWQRLLNRTQCSAC